MKEVSPFFQPNSNNCFILNTEISISWPQIDDNPSSLAALATLYPKKVFLFILDNMPIDR